MGLVLLKRLVTFINVLQEDLDRATSLVVLQDPASTDPVCAPRTCAPRSRAPGMHGCMCTHACAAALTPCAHARLRMAQVPAPSILSPATKALSIIVPAYNEQARLGASLDEAIR